MHFVILTLKHKKRAACAEMNNMDTKMVASKTPAKLQRVSAQGFQNVLVLAITIDVHANMAMQVLFHFVIPVVKQLFAKAIKDVLSLTQGHNAFVRNQVWLCPHVSLFHALQLIVAVMPNVLSTIKDMKDAIALIPTRPIPVAVQKNVIHAVFIIVDLLENVLLLLMVKQNVFVRKEVFTQIVTCNLHVI